MELSRLSLEKILENSDVEKLSLENLEGLFLSEETIREHAPSGAYSVDPRTGEIIVYSEARTRRPHDNRSPGRRVSDGRENAVETVRCVICEGKTTGVVDVAPLSDGFTFINKNLFPAVYPHDEVEGMEKVSGFHFLQWTSSIHGRDWHNMSTEDLTVVMRRLGILEERLLSYGKYQYVIVIKNYGREVGGSLSHGHQQIIWTDAKPGHFLKDELFSRERGMSFSSYMLEANPSQLIVKDYGRAVLVVPYFMKRQFDMILLLKDAKKTNIFQLEDEELRAVAMAFHDAARSIVGLMPRRGRNPAYNIVTHNTGESGLYFEFLPYMQEMGGLERLGFYICEGNPENAARLLRREIEGEEAS